MNPISKAQSGLWYDPSQPGNGFNIRVIGDIVAIQLYAGSVPGLYPTPVWFEAEGTAGQPDFDLNLVHAALGVHGQSTFEVVGRVQFSATTPGTLVANIILIPRPGFSPPPPEFSTVLSLQPLTLDFPA